LVDANHNVFPGQVIVHGACLGERRSAPTLKKESEGCGRHMMEAAAITPFANPDFQSGSNNKFLLRGMV
jgi:hypothetical protein